MAGSLHARGTLAKFFVLGAGAMFAYLVLVPLLHMGGAGHSLVQQGHAHATPSTASLRDTRDSQHGVAVRPEDGADPGRAVAARRREGTASERHAEVHEMLHGIVSKALADHAREAKRLQESEGRGHIAERPAPQDPEALAIAHAEMAKKAAALALQDVQGTAAQHSRRVLDILDLITKRLDDVTETKDLVRELLHWSKEHEAKFHGPGSSVGDNADDLYNAQEQNKDPVPNVPIEDFLDILQDHLSGNKDHKEFVNALLEMASENGLTPAVPQLPAKTYLHSQEVRSLLAFVSKAGGIKNAADVLSTARQTDEPKEWEGLRKTMFGWLSKKEALLQHQKLNPQMVSGVMVGPRCLEKNASEPLTLRPCALGGPPQAWVWTSTQRIKFGKDNKCLDATGLGEGDALVTKRCSKKAEGQVWDRVLKGQWGQLGAMRSAATGLCIAPKGDLVPHAKEPGIVLAKCDDSCRQLWILKGNRTTHNAIVRDDSVPVDDMKHRSLKTKKGERVLCWVMTLPKNHARKAVTVQHTWGRRCDTVLYMTTAHFPELNTVVLSTGEEEDRHFLWRKSMLAWMYVYKHHMNDADWFLRADDDTFINTKNLRAFLGKHDPSLPWLFGRHLKAGDDEFLSGGATTIMSAESLRRLGDRAAEDAAGVFWEGDTFADDMEICMSLRRLGIYVNSSRDEQERERFHTLNIMEERQVRRPDLPSYWYWSNSFHPPKEGADCCSPTWIATHYVDPNEIMTFDDLTAMGCEGAGKHPWEL